MRKRKFGRKLSRKKDQRKALLKSLASALLLKEKIKTTKAKAEEVSYFVEKLITKAKSDNLSSKRFLYKFFSPKIAKKIANEIAPKYKERKGGYTRIIKLGSRKLDGAKMVVLELVK